MMRSLFFFLLHVILLHAALVSAPRSAEAQLMFGGDSGRVRYSECLGETAIINEYIFNKSKDTQVFDLSFIDENTSWRIERSSIDSTPTMKINDIVLAPGESMWVDLFRVINIWDKQDTLVITNKDGIVDSYIAIGEPLATEFTPRRVRHDFQVVELGDSAFFDFPLEVTGEIPYAVHSFFKEKEGWEIQNLQRGDTIFPGETRMVRVVMTPKFSPGIYTSYIAIVNICGSVEITPVAKVPASGVHWTTATIRDTITNCRKATEYVVELTNTATMDVLIDSIGFTQDHDYGWTLGSQRPLNQILAPGGTIQFTASRNIHAGTTFLIVFTADGNRDTLPIRVLDRSAVPVIKNYIDTIIFNRKPGETINFIGTVENLGAGEYQVSGSTSTGNALWNLIPPDPKKVIGKKESVDFELQFVGTTVPGEYKMTYFLRGSPCDTTLKQTVIARVAQADVSLPRNELEVQVFPTVSSHVVHVHAQQAFRYSVIDLLGVNQLSGESADGRMTLDVRSLPQGRYYLRIESNNEVITREIAIVR